MIWACIETRIIICRQESFVGVGKKKAMKAKEEVVGLHQERLVKRHDCRGGNAWLVSIGVSQKKHRSHIKVRMDAEKEEEEYFWLRMNSGHQFQLFWGKKNINTIRSNYIVLHSQTSCCHCIIYVSLHWTILKYTRIINELSRVQYVKTELFIRIFSCIRNPN